MQIRYIDCGIEIYGRDAQAQAGGSGCGCSAVMLARVCVETVGDRRMETSVVCSNGSIAVSRQF